MVGPLWYATAPMRLLGGIAVVRRQCGRRVKGAEAPQGGAAPPWEACGVGCGARPHKSGAKAGRCWCSPFPAFAACPEVPSAAAHAPRAPVGACGPRSCRPWWSSRAYSTGAPRTASLKGVRGLTPPPGGVTDKFPPGSPDNAPDSRWLPWLLRPLGPSAAAESIREGVSPGTPILSRGWR